MIKKKEELPFIVCIGTNLEIHQLTVANSAFGRIIHSTDVHYFQVLIYQTKITFYATTHVKKHLIIYLQILIKVYL